MRGCVVAQLIDEAQQEEERRHAETVAQLRTELARAREARAEAEARLDQQSTTLRSKLEQDATSLAEHNTTNHTLRTEVVCLCMQEASRHVHRGVSWG